MAVRTDERMLAPLLWAMGANGIKRPKAAAIAGELVASLARRGRWPTLWRTRWLQELNIQLDVVFGPAPLPALGVMKERGAEE